MAHQTDRTRLQASYLNVIARCVLLAMTLALCSCNERSAEDKDAAFEQRLEEAGITRLPAPAYQFATPVDAGELTSTLVVDDLSEKISRGRNLIYCATSALRDELRARAADPRPERGSLDDVESPLPAGSFQFLRADAESVSEKLGSESVKPLLGALADEQAYWCVHFQRSLPFAQDFERLTKPLVFRSSDTKAEVAGFGDWEFEDSSVVQTLRREQVTIIDYKNDDDFVLRLNTQTSDDELILAKVSPQRSLASTLKAVVRRVKRNRLRGKDAATVQDGEAFAIPVITVNLVRTLADLPPGFQTIQFRLDEKGATLEGMLGYWSLAEDAAPRQLVFDKPFLLYAKSKASADPYLVLWVDNPELMEAPPVSELE